MMRNPDAVAEPAFYDHEHEASRERERRADDWGADSLFSGNPRRRFDRRPTHGFERRASGPSRPAPLPPAADLAEGVKWSAPAPQAAATPVAEAPAAPAVEPPGRRTVVVTGRPGAARRPAATAQRRPPRTAQDRLASRPDRVAGWAFGLGLLLIGIAAAPL